MSDLMVPFPYSQRRRCGTTTCSRTHIFVCPAESVSTGTQAFFLQIDFTASIKSPLKVSAAAPLNKHPLLYATTLLRITLLLISRITPVPWLGYGRLHFPGRSAGRDSLKTPCPNYFTMPGLPGKFFDHTRRPRWLA